jgi:hypothetical protein
MSTVTTAFTPRALELLARLELPADEDLLPPGWINIYQREDGTWTVAEWFPTGGTTGRRLEAGIETFASEREAVEAQWASVVRYETGNEKLDAWRTLRFAAYQAAVGVAP